MEKEPWKQKIDEMHFERGIPACDLIDVYKEFYPEAPDTEAYSKVRHYIRHERERREIGAYHRVRAGTIRSSQNISMEPEEVVETVAETVPGSGMENGAADASMSYDAKESTYTLNNIIQLAAGELITPDIMMEAHHLDGKLWEVVSYKNNYWETQQRGGTAMVLYQSKLVVRPKKVDTMTIEDVDAAIERQKLRWNKTTGELRAFLDKRLTQKVKGHVLEVDIPDLHVGLLAWREETGNDYDLKIVAQRFREVIADIAARCVKDGGIDKICLVTLGDLLHVDNEQNTTTKGTVQQVDGRIAKIYDLALDLLVDAIRVLREIAPVEYIYLSGNHDRVLGRALSKSVECVFLNDARVTCDTTPNPQKVKMFGKCLVGFTHGDMPKQNLSQWISSKFRSMFGNAKFVEVHTGHNHTQFTSDRNGVIERHLPTISENSFWEHQQGYNSERACLCYVWDRDHGLYDTWISNF